ncbi:helix-turn-helix domain-containing protein [Micromonospora sp. SH-82]|uniref:helix-turn-helix domain-containing protein n=1 Tax=Micromonospora sp. SH-82 TaxID=3132938 RepID=UPI003EBC05B7
MTGLRRAEVALLAGVSPDYYTRLERGNLSGVSDNVLDALCRALQLDEAERSHLYDLARAANANPRLGRAAPARQLGGDDRPRGGYGQQHRRAVTRPPRAARPRTTLRANRWLSLFLVALLSMVFAVRSSDSRSRSSPGSSASCPTTPSARRPWDWRFSERD